MSLADEILAAQDLIRDPENWCQGALARDKNGMLTVPHNIMLVRANYTEPVQFCANGAVIRVGMDSKAYRFIQEAAMDMFGTVTHRVNDKFGHDAVMSVFDEAVRRAKDDTGTSV